LRIADILSGKIFWHHSCRDNLGELAVLAFDGKRAEIIWRNLALASRVSEVSEGILVPTYIGSNTCPLAVVVHGRDHKYGKKSEKPDHGKHKVNVCDHAKTILSESLSILCGKLVLLFVVMTFTMLMMSFLLVEEFFLVSLSSSSLSLLLS
jgi:hypothetical protein